MRKKSGRHLYKRLLSKNEALDYRKILAVLCLASSNLLTKERSHCNNRTHMIRIRIKKCKRMMWTEQNSPSLQKPTRPANSMIQPQRRNQKIIKSRWTSKKKQKTSKRTSLRRSTRVKRNTRMTKSTKVKRRWRLARSARVKRRLSRGKESPIKLSPWNLLMTKIILTLLFRKRQKSRAVHRASNLITKLRSSRETRCSSMKSMR